MEKDRGFNFKLLVPPRVNSGQISAVRPQEIQDSDGFMHTLQQAYKEPNLSFTNTSMVMPTKPNLSRQDVSKTRVVPPMEKEENVCSTGQLCSKLFDEVEKVKNWKVKVDSETVQRERKLQENKRTIETQRKAIQELQFGNERLSIKLEEQISENVELRNKNNATWNLCNILKDTFQHSAEKMHQYESEREETHTLFLENSENIQRMIAAFETLSIQAKSDRDEMQKVKESMLQCEDLKMKFEHEYNMKQEEVAILKAKLKDEENELQKMLLNLHETQESCKQHKEATNQHYELLKKSKEEHDLLFQQLQIAEKLYKDTEEKRETLATELQESKQMFAQLILNKDLSMEEISKVRDQQAEKLVEIQATVHMLQNSLTSEIQRAKELELNLTAIHKELEKKTAALGEITELSAKKDQQIKIIEEELGVKSKCMESLKGKIEVIELRVQELTTELSSKNEEAQILKNTSELLSSEKNLLEKACEEAEKTRDDLKENACKAEIKVQDMQRQLSIERKKNELSLVRMKELKNDLLLQEVRYNTLLSNFNEVQSERDLIQAHTESGSDQIKALKANLKTSEEKASWFTKDIQRLEEENQHLRDEVKSLSTKIQEQCQETENLQINVEEQSKHFKEEVIKKEKQIQSVEAKLCNLKANFQAKCKTQEECQKENKLLKKQMSKESERCSQLENELNYMKENSQNIKKLHEEQHQKLLEDHGSKIALAAELQYEVEKLKIAASEAIKNQEAAEMKCQHKIADMVALMEKHKSQYDRMVEEKDREVEENKKKVEDAITRGTSLEMELSNNRAGNDHLKKELKKIVTDKENLESELHKLKTEISSMNISQMSEKTSKQDLRCVETPKPTSTPVFSKTRKTASFNKENENNINAKRNVSKNTDMEHTTPLWSTTNRIEEALKNKEIKNEYVRTPTWSNKNMVEATPKIKSFRIRTPPSYEKAVPWRKSTLELDPKSDSSEHNLTFANKCEPSAVAPQRILNIFKKSPAIHKSPGNSLKLAAIKRMRDAGWTTVTASERKKKRGCEKIFA